jgi:hypothetical protein
MTPEELIAVVDAWTSRGGPFPQGDLDRHYLTTTAEAHAVVRALGGKDLLSPDGVLGTLNLHGVAGLIQSSTNEEVDAVFRAQAAPLLREIVAAGLRDQVSPSVTSGTDVIRAQKRAESLLFALKVAAFYGHPHIIDLIATAARHPSFDDHYMWSTIFDYAERHNPDPERLIEALRNPLPGNSCRIAFLDFCNVLAFDSRIAKHPFDTEEGVAYLLSMLEHDDPGYDSHAISAIAAAPFLSVARQEQMLRRARSHSHTILHDEARWAGARAGAQGSDAFLHAAALAPQTYTRANKYMNVLGVKPPRIADPISFAAMTCAADWLSNEQDFFGTSPRKVYVHDRRILHWPPEGAPREAWIIGFGHYIDGEELSGAVTLVGELVDRVDTVRPKPLKAYAEAASRDPALYKLYQDSSPEDVFWRTMLVRLNPALR